ncbi:MULTISPECIES: hypothetical protein [unclassified Janthinobacterium]|uniref:hypothetical protein n=1 Tax=unclassified Janthinobacterium TaxID=2610881 RepID=UPI0012F75358|nr:MULTISPECIES: hypothetical protein [unclassified Janthinobacterium]MEC5160005.1 hypothetical protein [Janthinobacterium sp. CG_S6]
MLDAQRRRSMEKMRTFNQSQGMFTIYDPGYHRVAPELSTPARAAAVRFEETVRRDSIETGAFFSWDGTMLSKRSGLVDHARFLPRDLAGTAGALFTHNHPSGLSFSCADVGNAIGLGLSELRAVSPAYRHVMTAMRAWPKESTIQGVYDEELRLAYGDVADMVNRGELSVQYATAEIHHRAWERASTRLGLNYIREAS